VALPLLAPTALLGEERRRAPLATTAHFSFHSDFDTNLNDALIVAGSARTAVVFHEASHTLVAPWRPDPLPKALQQAAAELGVPLPRDLWHPILFYTTGDVVRRALKQAGEPAYTPYMYRHGLWRGSWARFREAVEKVWPAYLEGESTLWQAAREVLQSLPSEERHRKVE
jgi:hypothetical protein